jgi:prepilin signal peptidase PulO-like enzyme (type II secretory pathway)
MIIFLFILGTIMGSFYLVIATRLPKNEDVIFSRSHCDSCEETLKWYQLIPLLSFILFKGKCPKCHQKISILNPIVELTCGVLFALMFYLYGISYNFYMGLIVSSLLIIIFISDFKFLIILDSPLIVSSVLTIILKYYYFGYQEVLKSILGGIILFSIMYLTGLFGKWAFKREALGGGDIKFAFVMGLILGSKLGLASLILSSFLALPVSATAVLITKNNEVPFGPFLSGALFIVFVFLNKFQNLINLLFSV